MHRKHRNQRRIAKSCLNRPAAFGRASALFDTIKAIRSTSNVSPTRLFRARARYDFYRAMNDQFTNPQTLRVWELALGDSDLVHRGFHAHFCRGTAAASLNSMPGQPLYQLKRNIENVQLAMATSKRRRRVIMLRLPTAV